VRLLAGCVGAWEDGLAGVAANNRGGDRVLASGVKVMLL
jgi:hypothetical protein